MDDFGELFNIYLDKVDKEIGKYIDKTEDAKLKPEIKKKLKGEGWNDDDIENYIWIISDLDYFKIKFLDVIIEIMFYKYSYFKINFNPNSIALEFLKKAIGEKIMYYISYKMDISGNIAYSRQDGVSDVKEINSEKLDYLNHKIQLGCMDELTEMIKDVSNRGTIYRKNISNEIKKLILCLISMSELKRWNMRHDMNHLQWEIDHFDSFNNEEYKRDPRELDLYNELFHET